MSKEDKFKKVISHAKEYGFVFQSSEIYDGLSAVYDYGQNGTDLKNNIKDYWLKAMVQLNDNIVNIDSAILMHPKIWKASGHVDAFNDPLIDNKDSKKRYRADVLIEDYISKIDNKIQKEISKAKKKFGENFDKEQFVSTNSRILNYNNKISDINKVFSEALEKDDLKALKKLIEDLEIACPVSGSKNWTDVKQFNLMFGTKLGASAESAMDLYLRPETAQGIFVNFLNVQKTSRLKIPFGIAQIGKAFRNEIVARQFIFRMREFEQMEMQFFIKPGTQQEWYAKWKENRLAWHLSLGLGEDNYRFHDHDKLAHYADAACDIEFNFPFGFKELEGIHSRTDFDLTSHEKFSSKKIKYFDTLSNESFTPYVLETSIGLDRMFLAIFSKSLIEEKLEDGSSRTVLKFPKILAPKKVAVLPLLKKDGLPELSKQILEEFKWDYNCVYDEKDAIGRRYRRQDALGTPYCLTVDHQSLEDRTITIRDRDTMKQQRLTVQEVKNKIKTELDLKSWLTF
ncbi:glycine--tRNA ligase [Flavobacteriaceae bacterium]|jgi:glycyl-tRNA synthetase|nr:glycine--tRNA ligase [Flavobacteriaceae bacterium]MBT5493405.1 glycine--tRNA ligase [Flavobacteriaceae bacterium]MBT6654054.1 glycine--tRNA ligase [Flavobacteriaceae bacterium]MDA7566384.1 glycine--tRNA ligase [Flavobacteriaceae bacterium]MDA8807870.1 glycine--tRNA ligase [Flavobacteriaceae bacterium]|tara:strand:- start:780 stop:2315 length:1536 start_codon:yes stop_codon:yes gene_type:complete